VTEVFELGVGVAVVVLLLVLGAGGMLARQFFSERRERRRMRHLEKVGMHLPASLHPLIDPDICISSAACVAACPEGDVIGLVGGAGRLIHGAACVGHGRCAAECPVGAIRLVFGTAERGVDIPTVTPDFETSRAGVYVAGELGGMGLIRNAIRQGVAAARHAVQALKGKPGAKGVFDVAVVGAGPAGFGAALTCLEAGVSYLVLEQDTVGGTVAHFPRKKVILTEPVAVPLFGTIHRAEMSKEELLELWGQVLTETKLAIQTGVKLEGIDGEDGGFTLKTTAGEFRARKVILAIGRRGTPRKLGVPGEDTPRVMYGLVDPDQFKGEEVLVVGGGDSAIEAATSLAGDGEARVTISYRGESFFRAKEANRNAIEALIKAGKIKVVFQSTVKQVFDHEVILNTPAGDLRVAASYVLALLGGDAPTVLLSKLGIRIDRWFGKPPAEKTRAARLSVVSRGAEVWIGGGLILLGLAVLAYLSWVGRRYYLLSADARELSPVHERLRSSGPWGHGIGIVSTLVMLTNFFYAARKRLELFRGLGPTRHWLTVHAIIGLMTPAVIGFHAAFQHKNLIADVTYYAVGVVVFTGLIGRYVYGRIQSGDTFKTTTTALTVLKRFMRIWRLIHVLLALLMVLAIVLHVAVSLLLGYRWIF
jgi:dihydropyrimidine dehydrogenase (NAD+) subunit PreT